MSEKSKHFMWPGRLPVFIAVHLLVLSFAWVMASLVSKSYETPSHPSVYIRLVPVGTSS